MGSVNWHTFFFYLTSLLACGFAVGVVLAGNIVRMAFYLVMSLAAVAGLFFLAGADFVAATQIMVYVGGTLVLLVFGVMLTARGPFVNMQTGGGQWILAAIGGGALLAVLLQAAFSVRSWAGPREAVAVQAAPTATPLGMGLLGARTDQAQAADAARRGGMSGYLLPFEIISVHLVVVLVGAAYLARSRKRIGGRGRPRDGDQPQSASDEILLPSR